MRGRSKRIIWVIPYSHKDAEEDHVRIGMEGLEEEAHLELIKVTPGEEERMSARGDPEKTPEERAKGARRPKSQERFHGRDRISTIEEVRTGKLETTGEAVGIGHKS